MKTKRRGKQQGPTHRITMTFPENLFQVMSDASDHYGYSISEMARRVIDRGVGAGLLHAETPHKKGTSVIRLTDFREYADAARETLRLNEAQLKILEDRLKLADKVAVQQAKRLLESSEVITEMARDLELLRARTDA